MCWRFNESVAGEGSVLTRDCKHQYHQLPKWKPITTQHATQHTLKSLAFTLQPKPQILQKITDRSQQHWITNILLRQHIQFRFILTELTSDLHLLFEWWTPDSVNSSDLHSLSVPHKCLFVWSGYSRWDNHDYNKTSFCSPLVLLTVTDCIQCLVMWSLRPELLIFMRNTDGDISGRGC